MHRSDDTQASRYWAKSVQPGDVKGKGLMVQHRVTAPPPGHRPAADKTKSQSRSDLHLSVDRRPSLR